MFVNAYDINLFNKTNIQCASEKSSAYIFLNYSVKTESISVSLGVQHAEEIPHQKLTNSPVSPE